MIVGNYNILTWFAVFNTMFLYFLHQTIPSVGKFTRQQSNGQLIRFQHMRMTKLRRLAKANAIPM